VIFRYYPETDTFYLEIKDNPSVESEEIVNGVVVDYDENGEVVGVEIEDASQRKMVEVPLVGKVFPVSA